MSDTPTTKAGRRLLAHGDDFDIHWRDFRPDVVAGILAIETEARAELDVLRERAEYVVREYDKTSLTHDTAYESVAEGIDWLRIALDPTHPLYAALARQEADHE